VGNELDGRLHGKFYRATRLRDGSLIRVKRGTGARRTNRLKRIRQPLILPRLLRSALN
jgi:hypothetical protein